MRFVLLVIIIVSLGLAGCEYSDNQQVIFSGESKHWDGEIVLNKESGLANFYLNHNRIDEKVLKQIEVSIQSGQRSITLEVELLKKGDQITIPIPEDVLSDSNNVDSLEVTVSWGSDYFEEFKLIGR